MLCALHELCVMLKFKVQKGLYVLNVSRQIIKFNNFTYIILIVIFVNKFKQYFYEIFLRVLKLTTFFAIKFKLDMCII